MGSIEEGQKQHRQRASVLREYADELLLLRGPAPPKNIIYMTHAERAALLASPPSGYHSLAEKLEWYTNYAYKTCGETKETFSRLAELNGQNRYNLPEGPDSFRQRLQGQYERIAELAEKLGEHIGNAAMSSNYVIRGAWATANRSANLEHELLQQAQALDEQGDNL